MKEIKNNFYVTGPLTVFVAPNTVFNNNKINNSNPELAKKSLQCHFMMRLLTPSDIRNERTLLSLSGDRVRFNIYGNVSIYKYNLLNTSNFQIEIIIDYDTKWYSDNCSATVGH